jgi:hypothetical protein
MVMVVSIVAFEVLGRMCVRDQAVTTPRFVAAADRGRYPLRPAAERSR